jgi:hypothetical protein
LENARTAWPNNNNNNKIQLSKTYPPPGHETIVQDTRDGRDKIHERRDRWHETRDKEKGDERKLIRNSGERREGVGGTSKADRNGGAVEVG